MAQDNALYSECFHSFVHAMRNDYVCFQQARSIDSQPYMKAFSNKVLNGEGYDIQFVAQIDAYLSRFKNPAVRFCVDHSQTSHYPDYTWGMSVRRHGDALYVVDASAECGLQRGDRIVAASTYGEPNFLSMPTMDQRYGDELYGSEEERQLWDRPLHFMNRVLVDCGEGERRWVKLEPLPRPEARPPFELQTVRGETLLLMVRDLTDDGGLRRFVDENRPVLESAGSLIVDVRGCSGGTETAAAPLVPFVADAPLSLARYMEASCLTNYSQDNCSRQIAEFEYALRTNDYPDEVRGLIARWQKDLAERSGQGLVEEDAPVPEGCEEVLEPAGRAERVCLLTDVHTRDGAEVLAEACRDSGRATVVGRPTMGSRGFFNPAAVTVGCFSLIYPTSRFTDEGLARHHAGVGVPVDVHVAWTPEFFERDLDVDAALEAMRG